MCLLYRAFRQIKIRHIFIMQFGGYFVKFYSHQIFRPYCMLTKPNVQLVVRQRMTIYKLQSVADFKVLLSSIGISYTVRYSCCDIAV